MPSEKQTRSESAVVTSTALDHPAARHRRHHAHPDHYFHSADLPAKYKRPTSRPALQSSKFDDYFLAGGAMASLVAFATRNFTTVLALI
jgi:hypothetical protein